MTVELSEVAKLPAMDRKKMLEAMKKTYQEGYKAGFTDACDLMRGATTDLVASMEESLDSKTIVVEEREGLE